ELRGRLIVASRPATTVRLIGPLFPGTIRSQIRQEADNLRHPLKNLLEVFRHLQSILEQPLQTLLILRLAQRIIPRLKRLIDLVPHIVAGFSARREDVVDQLKNKTSRGLHPAERLNAVLDPAMNL